MSTFRSDAAFLFDVDNTLPGYADYLGALQRYRGEYPDDQMVQIALIEDSRAVGEDQGGYREDVQHCGTDAEI